MFSKRDNCNCSEIPILMLSADQIAPCRGWKSQMRLRILLFILQSLLSFWPFLFCGRGASLIRRGRRARARKNARAQDVEEEESLPHGAKDGKRRAPVCAIYLHCHPMKIVVEVIPTERKREPERKARLCKVSGELRASNLACVTNGGRAIE